jgi:hypothetical protein
MTNKKTNEGLGQIADEAERDHEVQMARAELYKIGKYSILLNRLLANVTEEEGLEAWQQAKITKAADYIDSVYHALETDPKVMSPAPTPPPAMPSIIPGMSESQISDYKSVLEKAMHERNSENKLKKDVHTAKVGHAADVSGRNYSAKKLEPLKNRGGDSADELKTAIAKMKRAGRAEQKHGKDAGYLKTLGDWGKDPRKRK